MAQNTVFQRFQNLLFGEEFGLEPLDEALRHTLRDHFRDRFPHIDDLLDDRAKDGEFRVKIGEDRVSLNPNNPADMVAADNLMQRAATERQFNLSDNAKGWSHVIDGEKAVFLETKHGMHTEVMRQGYDLTPQASGAMRYTNLQNGSSYESTKLKDGQFFDISNYNPVEGSGFGVNILDEKTREYSTGAHFKMEDDGSFSVTVSGDLKKNAVLVKAPDGGIRTVDKHGNVTLTDLSDRQLKKQGMSKEDIAAHREFEAAAAQNPELLEQGFRTKPHVISPMDQEMGNALKSHMTGIGDFAMLHSLRGPMPMHELNAKANTINPQGELVLSPTHVQDMSGKQRDALKALGNKVAVNAEGQVVLANWKSQLPPAERGAGEGREGAGAPGQKPSLATQLGAAVLGEAAQSMRSAMERASQPSPTDHSAPSPQQSAAKPSIRTR